MMAESLHEKLGELVTRILHEERDFHERARQMRIDQQTLNRLHAEFKPCHERVPNHDRLRQAHEAMFKVHRKIASDHNGILVYCRRISEKLQRGGFCEREIAAELENLESIFSSMQLEHENMERERRKILEEHEALVETLGGSSDADSI
jgi:hypothetical protein